MEHDNLENLLSVLFQAHPWHGVAPQRDAQETYNAFIEIVPTDSVKYELDKVSGILRVDRPQRYSNICPTLYGFIPQTYCGTGVGERCSERTGQPGIEGDGDPLDICVLTEKPVTHGNIFVAARPIGGLRMVDDQKADDKIIAVLESDVTYGDIRDISECPRGLIDRVRHYFLSYKMQPGETSSRVSVDEVYDREEALLVIKRSIVDYTETFGQASTRVDNLRRLLGKAL